MLKYLIRNKNEAKTIKSKHLNENAKLYSK